MVEKHFYWNVFDCFSLFFVSPLNANFLSIEFSQRSHLNDLSYTDQGKFVVFLAKFSNWDAVPVVVVVCKSFIAELTNNTFWPTATAFTIIFANICQMIVNAGLKSPLTHFFPPIFSFLFTLSLYWDILYSNCEY